MKKKRNIGKVSPYISVSTQPTGVIMKTIHAVCVGLVIMIALPVRAEESASPRFTRATFEQTEASLLEGLQHHIPQIVTSSALTVKQLKELYPERSFSRFVIPLMRIVKDDDAPETQRIVAALALHQLRTSRGDFAIARTAKFTSNARVRHMYTALAYERLQEQHPELVFHTNTFPALLTLQAPEPLSEMDAR
jgi:hypothetical protein